LAATSFAKKAIVSINEHRVTSLCSDDDTHVPLFVANKYLTAKTETSTVALKQVSRDPHTLSKLESQSLSTLLQNITRASGQTIGIQFFSSLVGAKPNREPWTISSRTEIELCRRFNRLDGRVRNSSYPAACTFRDASTRSYQQ
jgi:hypothetical protein